MVGILCDRTGRASMSDDKISPKEQTTNEYYKQIEHTNDYSIVSNVDNNDRLDDPLQCRLVEARTKMLHLYELSE